MTPEDDGPTGAPTGAPAPRVAADRPSSGPGHLVALVLERARLVVVVGSVTSLALSLASFGWGIVKAGSFVRELVADDGRDDLALVKLFQSIDIILIGTVLLTIGLGLWELFVHDLRLPPALSTSSFADLKAKTATTLLLVIVVRFLETLVSGTSADDLLRLAIAVTLVGALLLAFANAKR